MSTSRRTKSPPMPRVFKSPHMLPGALIASLPSSPPALRATSIVPYAWDPLELSASMLPVYPWTLTPSSQSSSPSPAGELFSRRTEILAPSPRRIRTTASFLQLEQV